MSVKILSIALLLLSVCLCTQCSAVNRRLPGKRIVHPCCTKVSSADISAQVTGKHITQKASGKSCVDAVIFPTTDGKACVDPSAGWVKRLIATEQ